jgi:hypothetical protein
MSLNQRVTAEFSTCTPTAPHSRDLSIQTSRTNEEKRVCMSRSLVSRFCC